jgi:pimeloyl-ACP methyl ester carboxylesterase
MADTKLRSRWVNANGVKTHYTESGGDGKILVALHGGGAGSSGVAGMGLVMEELADEFHCIAPDSIGGFGNTDPLAPAPYGLNSRAQHTADFLDALCLDKFTILGNSQGAYTAAQYAITHPDRVEKLIIVSSLTIATQFGIKQAPNAAQKALDSYDGTREGMRSLLEALIIDKSRITDKLIDERQAAANRPGAFKAFKDFGASIRRMRDNPLYKLQQNMSTALPELTKHIPTLVIWGENDPFAVPETGRALQKFLPDAKWVWVPNAGHQVQTDKPRESAQIMREFLRQPSPQSKAAE